MFVDMQSAISVVTAKLAEALGAIGDSFAPRTRSRLGMGPEWSSVEDVLVGGRPTRGPATAVLSRRSVVVAESRDSCDERQAG